MILHAYVAAIIFVLERHQKTCLRPNLEPIIYLDCSNVKIAVVTYIKDYCHRHCNENSLNTIFFVTICGDDFSK